MNALKIKGVFNFNFNFNIYFIGDSQMKINKTRNQLNNQIFSFVYNQKLNTCLTFDNLEMLFKRSLIKGYFDKVFFYKLIRKESKGFNNIFFSLDKKNLSLKAFFLSNENSKFNIDSFDIITLEYCKLSFDDLIFNNTYLYKTIKTPFLRKYSFNDAIVKETVENVLKLIQVKKELFFYTVNEHFKKMRIKDIY